MQKPIKKPKVVLSDGNAYVVMALTIKGLRNGGADKEYIEKYKKEAKSGDYDHLLQVTMEYVDVVLDKT